MTKSSEDGGSYLSSNVWTGPRGSRMRLASSASAENTIVDRLIDIGANEERKEVQIIKMVSVILIPIVTLVILTIMSLVEAVDIQQEAYDAQKLIQRTLVVDEIVTDFQVERGTTAGYISSRGLNQQAYERLLVLRAKTDTSLEQLNEWPDGGLKVPGLTEVVFNLQNPVDFFLTRQSFSEHLYRFRALVKSHQMTVEENIRFYTLINLALLDWSVSDIVLPESGNMWAKVVATTNLLRSADAVGIQRALGSAFYTLCTFSLENFKWFMSLEGESVALQNLAFGYYSTAFISYKFEYIGSALEKRVIRGKEDMADPPLYQSSCQNFSSMKRFANSDSWFSNMTAYMIILSGIRLDLNAEIIKDLEQVMQSSSTQVVIYSILMVAVAICSIAISVWYTMRIYAMTEKVRNYATKITYKSHQLQAERRKTDLLLYQMLPPFVTSQLKANQTVEAEHFDNVSVYFSDIVGFTDISSKSSPLQVIDLLNNLYSVFDASIDRYDVYKVETIGDAYMVASGLPERTKKHASEIANLSLELVQSVADFYIPHLPDVSLRLRIGVHTGPCVAGVVGLKMPRYCLFGSSVVIAARMEATSKAQMVHISQSTSDELSRIGGYAISPRDDLDKQVNDLGKTYWLQGKSISVSAGKKQTHLQM